MEDKLQNNIQFLQKVFNILDVNDVSKTAKSLSAKLKEQGMDDKKIVLVLNGLFASSLYVALDKVLLYIKDKPNLQDILERIVSNKKSTKLDIMQALDYLSMAAFNSSFIDEIESEFKKLMKAFQSNFEVMVSTTQYIDAISQQDPARAQRLALYLSQGRYAKLLSEML